MYDKHIKKEETTDWASKTGQTHLLIEDHVIQKLNWGSCFVNCCVQGQEWTLNLRFLNNVAKNNICQHLQFHDSWAIPICFENHVRESSRGQLNAPCGEFWQKKRKKS